VQPYTPEQPNSLWSRLYARLGKRSGRELFERFSDPAQLQPGWTLSKALALVCATIIHGITLVCFIAGIVLLVTGWGNLTPMFLALLLLGIAWVARPRFGKLEGQALERAAFPTLYGLADQVADSLKTSRAAAIVVNEEFNASYNRVGWQQCPVVSLGLPLLESLDGQGKVALLAHELAHGANGDQVRGWYVGSAVNALAAAHHVFHPDYLQTDGQEYHLIARLANLLMRGVAIVPRMAAVLLSHLLWRDSQRAEYQADYLSAVVAGTDAAVMGLDVHHEAGAFRQVVREVALQQQPDDLFVRWRRRRQELPQRERERLRRVARLEESRLDGTHPPTAFRIAALQKHPVTTPQVTASAALHQQLEAELATLRPALQQRLVDDYRQSLY
jgi:heat shock protein HtpX